MYRLRAELRAHTADVRGVAVSAEGIIATASRDRTVALWNKDLLEPSVILRGHDHFVNALTFVKSGKLVTASSDTTLRVWDTKTAECLKVLEGHEKAVCAVSALRSKGAEYVISSSWDQTARIWDIESGACLRVLSGHQAAVWSAVELPDGRLVTVGADKTVKLWPLQGSNNTSSVLMAAHKDVIRDIVAIPPGSFTTVANDSSLICWKSTGELFSEDLRVSDLHDGSFTYSVDGMEASSGEWLFVTGGEDNAARITQAEFGSAENSGDIKVAQTIMHPGTVWSTCFSPNGDIVSACSDGVARVFTKDPSAIAAPDVVAAFEKSVSERQVNTKVIGGVDVTKLPSAAEALAVPGKKDGENKIVKTSSGNAEVHMWSSAEQKWSKVGDVVDGPNGGATLGAGDVNGKRYDFVFEVEIGDGDRKGKLGYNRGENPYLAAQRFIDENELSQEFLDQIAQFIEQQVPAEALQPATQGPSDPFTGASRYVPQGHDDVVMGVGQGDPLTGGSRYVPGSSIIPEGKLPPPRRLIPHRDGLISYKNTDQLDKIQQKLSDFNAEMARTNMHIALNMEEAQTFAASLIPKLRNRGGSTTVFDERDCMLVEKLLKWPTMYIFPALDIARLVVSFPSAGAYFFGTRNGAILEDVLRHISSEEATGPVHIMGCRFLCNIFGNRVVGEVARSEVDKILAATITAATAENRRARETYASLLINYAVLLHDSNATASERESVLSAAIERISGGETDEEVLYRLMLAMGTLISDDFASARKGIELGAARAAAEAAPRSARLQQVALEIATIVAT